VEITCEKCDLPLIRKDSGVHDCVYELKKKSAEEIKKLAEENQAL
jgi:uncharacterized Zn finger protein (UPF0148 family)